MSPSLYLRSTLPVEGNEAGNNFDAGHQMMFETVVPELLPTVVLEDDSDVVLDKGADVQQHSWLVNGAETELYVIRRVVVAQAEVVIVRVNPDGPRRFVRYGLLSYVVFQPRADLKMCSNILRKITVGLDIWANFIYIAHLKQPQLIKVLKRLEHQRKTSAQKKICDRNRTKRSEEQSL